MEHPLRDLDKVVEILKFAECRKLLEHVSVVQINQVLSTGCGRGVCVCISM